MELWTVYAPIAQITMMTGAMIENGMRRIAAKSGTQVRTTTVSYTHLTLPTTERV